jgi:hypothetical protein
MNDPSKTAREQRVKPPADMGQRRAHLRFEVVGPMLASLQSTETLQILNLGASGALVEGALSLPVNAEYQMQLVLDTHVSEATVKVRRVSAVTGEQGSVRYRIGLEFLAISPEAEDVIAQIVMADQAQV